MSYYVDSDYVEINYIDPSIVSIIDNILVESSAELCVTLDPVVTDLVGLTEQVIMNLLLHPTVDDNVLVEEINTLLLLLYPSVNDSITLTELVAYQLDDLYYVVPGYVDINYVDPTELSFEEVILVSEYTKELLECLVNEYDEVSTNDDLTLLLECFIFIDNENVLVTTYHNAQLDCFIHITSEQVITVSEYTQFFTHSPSVVLLIDDIEILLPVVTTNVLLPEISLIPSWSYYEN